ncbi:MAG: alpha/beta hydrolase [Chitinophagales bacterium]|nr:alpha/beta hydrolase [Chitinophagales bacterium]
MKKIIIPGILFLALTLTKSQGQSTALNVAEINNLVHVPGYTTSKYAAVPSFIKRGNGKKKMILIPGLGFDAAVFEDLMKANEKEYTMYAVTIPGFGNTKAPDMPDTTVSYGLQTWNRSMLAGLIKLIDREKIEKPIIAAHFVTATQIAMRMAIDFPDKVGAVIILGGPAKFIAIQQGKLASLPVKQMIGYTDNVTSKRWFKTMKKETFDQGNFIPEVYSVDSSRAQHLWNQVAAVPLPVMIRYSCEYFAADLIAEIKNLKCPLLVLRPTFNATFFQNPMNKNWIEPQLIESWNLAAKENPAIVIKDIPGTAAFVWKDNPTAVYGEIKAFVNGIK